MHKVNLGKTGITVPKNGFGALPIQRVGMDGALALLLRAYDGGFRYFDTARAYSDSEEKLGNAFEGKRDQVVIATKTQAESKDRFWRDIETSLSYLKSSYVDIYQFHNISFMPKPEDGSGLYEAMLDAKAQGMIKHIGITSHSIDMGMQIAESGLYESLQFPFSYLSGDREIELVNKCKENGVAFIAMKSLSGGLITNAAAAYAWASRFENVLPIWGVQRESELDEFLSFMDAPPEYNEESQALIDKDRAELSGNFCRACGYCMPCPQGIIINECARYSQMVRRMPPARFFEEEFAQMMKDVESCAECGQCIEACPYGINTPELLKLNLKDYKEIMAGKPI
ncbi:MAG: aldo/keto reductase [Eubacteriaceae bacterium]|nr:aldo/keto reductase [Eubacteriaceae bacterium]